jgi:hypothetical protein
MTKTQALHTLLTMRRFGGNFEQHLAAAGLNADPVNRQRLLDAFPEVERKYGPATGFYSEDLG